MGRRVTVEVVDDLDGSTAEGVATISFGLDGVEYEIDLCPANAARLREVLRRYALCARSGLRDAEPAARGARPSPVRSLDVEELRAVRAWARGRGFSVSDRGRLSEAVLSAYEEAHPNDRKSPRPTARGLWN
ncbi:histone-like nucleoid-structuring protein Lsr2 [Umezawaea tangerina]|uniref:histone-like nucleoid-structuring protein Lsr2 n=1 Tax=Umezawaea tangerina TaxID=84725 RepID=UPI000D053AD4|nr:Lsr2 family protein [Umezawaea tangerina]